MEADAQMFAAGAEAAAADIAAGRLVYRWHGHAGHFGYWIVTELLTRFGIEVNDGFGVCFVTDASVAFDDGYNAVLAAEIDRRCGYGAIALIFEEAKRQPEALLDNAKIAWVGKRDRN